MDYHLAVSKIYTNTDYNKACFNFTEEEAREKKLWRDVRPMPSLSELEAALVEASKDLSITNLWDDTVSEIYIQMRAVFGTGSDAAVIADVVTFERRHLAGGIKKPSSDFSDDGLRNSVSCSTIVRQLFYTVIWPTALP